MSDVTILYTYVLEQPVAITAGNHWGEGANLEGQTAFAADLHTAPQVSEPRMHGIEGRDRGPFGVTSPPMWKMVDNF